MSRTEYMLAFCLPMVSILSALLIIDGMITLKLNKADLKKNSGVVTEIRDVLYLTREKHEPNKKTNLLIIGFNNVEDAFKLSDKSEEIYLSLLKQVVVGDSINLYTRQDFFTDFHLKNSNEIYQIEKNGKVLFSLEYIKDNYRRIVKDFSIVFSVLLISTIIYFKFFL